MKFIKIKTFLFGKKNGISRLKLNNNNQEKYLKLMHSVNPIIIPRNHKVEEALKAANDNDIKPMNDLIKILEKPYETQEKFLNINFLIMIMNIKLFVVRNSKLKNDKKKHNIL